MVSSFFQALRTSTNCMRLVIGLAQMIGRVFYKDNRKKKTNFGLRSKTHCNCLKVDLQNFVVRDKLTTAPRHDLRYFTHAMSKPCFAFCQVSFFEKVQLLKETSSLQSDHNFSVFLSEIVVLAYGDLS